MYAPWAIPNDPRIALANMDAVFPKKQVGEKIYECICCGTTFNYAEGEHKNGYLVCPNPKCESEDLREITDTEQEVKDV